MCCCSRNSRSALNCSSWPLQLRAEVTHLITHLTCSGRVFSAPRGSRGIDQSAEGSGRQLEVSEEFVSPHTPAFRLPYRDAPQASGHSGPPHTQVAQAARYAHAHSDQEVKVQRLGLRVRAWICCTNQMWIAQRLQGLPPLM